MSKKIRFLPLAVFLFLLSVSSHAGNSRGSGGNVIVCREVGRATPTSIELLDFYEGRTRRGIQRSMFGSRDHMAQIGEVLERLRPFDPERAARYWKESREFQSNTDFQPGVFLVKINDSFHLSFPKGCEVEQIAVQTPPRFPEDKARFLVSRDLWRFSLPLSSSKCRPANSGCV